jgi:hypothetical protein
MPSEYDGDRTQTQMPSDAPEPENPPTLNLPADGDPPNASTFAQPFRVLADFIHWLKRPQAKSQAWTQAIQRWRSSLGHTRFAVDHMGFPSGQIASWDEHWFGQGSVTYTGTQAQVYPNGLDGWTHAARQTAGGVSSFNLRTPDVTTMLRHARLTVGEFAGDFAALWRAAVTDWNPSMTASLEWLLVSDSTAALTYFAGLAAPINVLVLDPPLLADFALFRRVGGGNWFAVTRGGGAETATDTLVSATSARMRIEWHGQYAADNGVTAVRFYLDGNLVATHTTNLPRHSSVQASSFQHPYFAAANPGGGAQTDVLNIAAPVRFRAGLYAQDLLL